MNGVDQRDGLPIGFKRQRLLRAKIDNSPGRYLYSQIVEGCRKPLHALGKTCSDFVGHNMDHQVRIIRVDQLVRTGLRARKCPGLPGYADEETTALPPGLPLTARNITFSCKTSASLKAVSRDSKT